jgi:hypothetical protein
VVKEFKMADSVLAQVLSGIATRRTQGGLDSVKVAVKERLAELKKRVVSPRFMTDEEKRALAKGN